MSEILFESTGAETRCRIDADFQRVLEAVSVSKVDPKSDKLKLDAVTVNGWWLARVSGEGSIRLRGNLPLGALSDRAVLTLVVSGDCHMHSDQSFFGKPGEICLTRWNNFDDVTFNGVFRYFAMYIPISDVERLVGDRVRYDRYIPTYEGAGAVIGAILTTWIDETLAGRNLGSLENMTEDFLRLMLRAFINCELAAAIPAPPNEVRIQKILAYLRLRLSDSHMTPMMAARECGISERQLYRDFAARGQRFGQVLRNLRLEEAATRLLRDRYANISDVSFECGFANPTHFARVFRHAFGESPGEYRERTRHPEGMERLEEAGRQLV